MCTILEESADAQSEVHRTSNGAIAAEDFGLSYPRLVAALRGRQRHPWQ